VVQSCTDGCAFVRHSSPGNRCIDLIDSGLRLVLVECHENDVKVRRNASRGKEAFQPIASKCDASVVAIVLDVRLRQSWVSEWVSSQREKKTIFTVYQANVGSVCWEISVLSWVAGTILAQRVELF